MKRLAVLRKLFFIVIISFLVSCSSEDDHRIHLSGDAVVLAFGDSLTVGVGAATGNDYPSVLSRALGVEVVNKGVSGEVSAEGLARLEGVLRDTRPALVILCHGGNDILRNLSGDELEANLERMIALIRSYDARVILVGVPGRSLFLSTLPVYQAVAERHELVAEMDALGELLADASMRSDRVHLNDNGYKALALALADKIVVK